MSRKRTEHDERVVRLREISESIYERADAAKAAGNHEEYLRLRVEAANYAQESEDLRQSAPAPAGRVMRAVKTKRAKNPRVGGQLKRAIKLYRSFRDAEHEEIVTVRVPTPAAAAVIGHVDYVGYTTTHEGKTVRYEHKFRAGSRPLMCASADGTQLLLLGGRYEFTEQGIVDIDARGRKVIPKSHGKKL